MRLIFGAAVGMAVLALGGCSHPSAQPAPQPAPEPARPSISVWHDVPGSRPAYCQPLKDVFIDEEKKLAAGISEPTLFAARLHGVATIASANSHRQVAAGIHSYADSIDSAAIDSPGDGTAEIDAMASTIFADCGFNLTTGEGLPPFGDPSTTP